MLFCWCGRRNRIHVHTHTHNLIPLAAWIQVANAERKRILQFGRIQWKPLAILSTFELVLSCILTLLHLIEQSHIAPLRFVCSFPLSFSYSLSLSCTHSYAQNLYRSFVCILFSKELSIAGFCSLKLFHPFLFLSLALLFCGICGSFYFANTLFVSIVGSRWPELSRKSFLTKLNIL